MSRQCLIIGGLLLAMLCGCPRPAQPPVPPPDAGTPPITPEQRPAYLDTAESFLAFLERGEPGKAWELLTEEAQKALPAEQLASDLAGVRPAGHKVVAHVGTPQAAYVLVALQGAATTPSRGLGLLLRPVGDTWRVSFFMPQAPDEVKGDDLALQKTGAREFTLTWTAASGSPQSLVITEF